MLSNIRTSLSPSSITRQEYLFYRTPTSGVAVFDTSSLGLVLFSDHNNIDSTDNRNARLILVIDNTKLIDRSKNFNILLLKEEIKINGIKPTLIYIIAIPLCCFKTPCINSP